MPRPTHLTALDVRFLTGVSRGDTLRQLDEIVELAGALDAAGVDPHDLAALEALDDDEVLDDAEALNAIRGDLRAQLGRVGRGEPPATEVST